MKLGTNFWWKAYFWLTALLMTGAVFFALQYSQSPAWTDVVGYGTWLVSLIGVFGFAYSRTIINERLWQTWFPIVVLWDVGVLVTQYVYEPLEMEPWLMNPWLLTVAAIITGILVLPEYVALYLYGYRSNPLWASKSGN